MMLALKSGPQIAAKVGNPAGLLCRRIWYSVGKSGVLGITEYRQGRPLVQLQQEQAGHIHTELHLTTNTNYFIQNVHVYIYADLTNQFCWNFRRDIHVIKWRELISCAESLLIANVCSNKK